MRTAATALSLTGPQGAAAIGVGHGIPKSREYPGVRP